MAQDRSILVIIPAFYEEQSVRGVIDGIRRCLPEAHIVVINDGSRDGTSQVARAAGAYVIDLPFNLGIGGAMQTGYKYAAAKGFDLAVQVDADGQHEPEDLPGLIRAQQESGADLVVGSRFLEDRGYRPSLARGAGIKLLAWLITLLTRKRVSDTTSGYRVANSRVIKLFAAYYPSDYPEAEVLILLHKHGLKVQEVPVSMSPRTTGRSSITPIRSFYYMFKVILAVMVQMTRRRKQVGVDA